MHALNTFNLLNNSGNHSIRQNIVDKNDVTIANSGFAKTLFHTLKRLCSLGLYEFHIESRNANAFDFYKQNIGAIRNGLVRLKNSDQGSVPVTLSNGEVATLEKNGPGVKLSTASTARPEDAINIDNDIQSIIDKIDNDVEDNPAYYGDTCIAAFKLSKIADSMIPAIAREVPTDDNLLVSSEEPSMTANVPGSVSEESVLRDNFEEITSSLSKCLLAEPVNATYSEPISKFKIMFGAHATKCLDSILHGSVNKDNWDTHRKAFDALEHCPASQRLAILGEQGARKFDLVASYFKSIRADARAQGVPAKIPVGANRMEEIFNNVIENGLNEKNKKDFMLALKIVQQAEKENKPASLSCRFAVFLINNQKTLNFDRSSAVLNFKKTLLNGKDFITASMEIATKINSMRFIKGGKEVSFKELGGGPEGFADEVVKFLSKNPEIYRKLKTVATDESLCNFMYDNHELLKIESEHNCYAATVTGMIASCEKDPSQIEAAVRDAATSKYEALNSIYPIVPPEPEAVEEPEIGSSHDIPHSQSTVDKELEVEREQVRHDGSGVGELFNI